MIQRSGSVKTKIMVQSEKDNALQPIRAFFAIQIPLEIQQQISELQTTLKEIEPFQKLRWTTPKNLHITLKFFPKVILNDRSNIIEVITHSIKNSNAFPLQFGKLALFPTTSHPKILSLEVVVSDVLNQLVNKMNIALQQFNYPEDNHVFQAHVTLARLKDIQINEAILRKIHLPIFPEIRVTQIYFFESRPNQTDSNYIPLACIDLNDQSIG